MAINYPTSLDSFTDPSPSDGLDSPSHSGLHTDLNSAVEALEAKVGVDSSAVTSSHDYKIAQLEARTSGKILQIVSAAKTDTFSTTSSTLTDITGLSVDITPTATSSNIVVMSQLTIGSPSATNFGLQIVRDSTAILTSDSGQNETITFTRTMGTATLPFTFVYVDSPATTSATTYKMQIRVGSGTVNVNIGSNTFYAGTSTITVMEVAA